MERTLALTDDQRPTPRNRLLAALPQEIVSSLRSHMEPVWLPRGRVLCEVEERLDRVYFVEAGAVSLVTVFEDGSTAEMATVGREGILGTGVLVGSQRALARYVVLMSGSALTVGPSRFQSILRESPELLHICEVYAQAFVRHLFRNVACNATHSATQRCARWLLMCADCTEDDTFELTHECLAEMLCLRRSTVTIVVGTLQKAGLLRNRRGLVTVLERPGLEAAACECYRVVSDGYRRAIEQVVGLYGTQVRLTHRASL